MLNRAKTYDHDHVWKPCCIIPIWDIVFFRFSFCWFWLFYQILGHYLNHEPILRWMTFFLKLHLLRFHVEVWARGFLNQQYMNTCTLYTCVTLSLSLIYLLVKSKSKSKSNLSTLFVLDKYVFVEYTRTHVHAPGMQGSQESFLFARSSTASCAPVDDTNLRACATQSVKKLRWWIFQNQHL